jgi:multidrug efflux pump subunit AcrB
LAPALGELKKKLPAGYSIEAGGTVEESAKGLRSIAVIFPMMIFLMLTILMVQLQSFRKMFLVISVAPLGLIGVVLDLLPTGTPMGLCRDPRHHRPERHDHQGFGDPGRPDRHGHRQRLASLGRGDQRHRAHRLRPIVLTAAAASLGMIPIAPEVFWGPMAYANIGGLFVATLLTLFFLPALCVAWFRIKEPR